MADAPLVSILIPTYNREAYLPATLASCRAQTWSNWEVIVVDDGSTDGTASIAESFAADDPRFRVIRSENRGQCAARNLAFSHSRGLWIKFLDDDDLLRAQALERLLLTQQRHQTPIVCGTTRGFWDQELASLQEDVSRLEAATAAPGLESTRTFPSLMELNAAQHPTFNEMLVSHALVESVSGFDARLSAAEEFNLMLRLSLHHPSLPTALLTEPPILLKRYHLNSLAVKSRTQTKIPWLLRSLRFATEDYLALPESQQRAVAPELKRNLFDQLYHSFTDAYRHAQFDDATAAWDVWQQGHLPKPHLTPRYRDTLHQLFSPARAESILHTVRQLRDRLCSTPRKES